MSMGPVVVKIGGAAVDAMRSSRTLARALVEMEEQLRRRDGSMVLVHGGGSAVDRLFEQAGIKAERVHGLRVTREEHMGLIAAAIAGQVGAALEAALVAEGGLAVALTLGGAGIRCVLHPMASQLGRVGLVERAVDNRLADWLRRELLPVVACVGDDGEGGLLNINGDDAAVGIARLIGASELVLLTDVPGVLGKDGSVIERLEEQHIDELIDTGVISGGMVPKVRGAVEASTLIARPVVIAPWNDEDAVAAIGRGERVGTMVVAAEAEEGEEGS